MRTTVLALAALAVTALVPPAVAMVPAGTAPKSAAVPKAAGVPKSAAAPKSAGVALGSCGAGQLCLWRKPDFTGARQIHELSSVDIESCVPLPAGGEAQSLANRTGRPVTTYQSAECAETAEFETYPGGGTWTPRSPYQVRAFKIWEN
ncbi:peptidase inhibitor family I36 protein [Streptomyces sp. BE147]|uniref:peptidase inhibitor family I36 protein n=1 Tax=Streptomyces sp. BE147 TaxID=3002524 RepID=UPI002E77694F|nr:peptidase inhibitor family I36 protein [Streptomyces sp. BE147]MEE1738581.1 peptidase inhibitor family I36 protein [Streptomyces sp. BE147]